MFGIPAYPRPRGFQYKRNLIRTCTIQLRYQNNERISQNEELIKSKLLNQYPLCKALMESELNFQIEEDKTPIVIHTKSKKKGFEFRTGDGIVVLQITNDSVTFTTPGNKYTKFEVALEHFVSVLTPLLLELGVTSFLRSAIRKVNVIDIKSDARDHPVNISNMVFNAALSDGWRAFPDVSSVKTFINRTIIADNLYQLNLAYGLQNSDLQGNHQLVLDLDMFKKEPFSASGDAVKAELTAINNSLFEVFHWALNPTLVTSLEV